jgi:hypothetical protein
MNKVSVIDFHYQHLLQKSALADAKKLKQFSMSRMLKHEETIIQLQNSCLMNRLNDEREFYILMEVQYIYSLIAKMFETLLSCKIVTAAFATDEIMQI